MQPFVTGPARLWTAFPTGSISNANAAVLSNYGSPVPFGTAENGFDIIQDPAFEPLMNDLGGQIKPFDRLYQGSDYIVAGVLTRYREPVFRALSEAPGYVGAGVFTEPVGFLGTLMGMEQRAVQIWVEYLYGAGSAFAKSAHVTGGLAGGVHFYSADWKGPIRRSTGTRPSKIHCVFHCQRIYNPATGAMASGDENMAAVSGLSWEVVP